MSQANAVCPPAARGERAAAFASWRVIEVIGGPGTGVGEFQSPGGIAVDRSGTLYVADFYNHRVQRITRDGQVATLGGGAAGRESF